MAVERFAVSLSPESWDGGNMKDGKGIDFSRMAIVFCLGFAVAFTIAYLIFSTPGDEGGEDAPPVVLGEEDVAGFITAVEESDYDGMARLGGELFSGSSVIPGHREFFGGYETGGFPPNTTYAFFTGTVGDSLARVLLTVQNDDGQVVSFLAEETPIAQ